MHINIFKCSEFSDWKNEYCVQHFASLLPYPLPSSTHVVSLTTVRLLNPLLYNGSTHTHSVCQHDLNESQEVSEALLRLHKKVHLDFLSERASDVAGRPCTQLVPLLLLNEITGVSIEY
ncbi:unnamed protein product [Meganyctiphanes norvegica]|uniref:Uncharacterized protein n=1 Tax=Meganyctiphanes norvegica TaxID=48144 RepID=A0AAV2R8I1_MEGNR